MEKTEINPYAAPGLKKIEEMEKQIICDIFQIDIKDLFRRISKRKIVEARQFFFWYKITKENKGPSIAKEYGFNHSTAIYSKNTINNLRETDKSFFDKTEKAIYAISVFNKTLKQKEL